MIEVAIIIALSVLFLHVCTWEGNILQIVRVKLWNEPPWLTKPLFDCPFCMTPWWGSLILLFGFLFDQWDLPSPFGWILILAVASGLNVLFASMIEEPDDEPVEETEP